MSRSRSSALQQSMRFQAIVPWHTRQRFKKAAYGMLLMIRL
jgi:hypothetical protein